MPWKGRQKTEAELAREDADTKIYDLPWEWHEEIKDGKQLVIGVYVEYGVDAGTLSCEWQLWLETTAGDHEFATRKVTGVLRKDALIVHTYSDDAARCAYRKAVSEMRPREKAPPAPKGKAAATKEAR